ncbi:hypothetical protein CONPUDRAFT_56223 [Coniophora puteana RWD-64-598 SS2]|uniref:CxC1-like cysteine cluster associated with KDZ transposases domain-containing protein n=1 Tax=Coniophora puteana (strain RWD-64-598) TaxID=741705 RepID=A0A5M3MRT5_CONPW|nr:uncharacterized protein CONPUDRAFT_56223 [Coniophora puteana RWD-64-598 SS2]EIW81261.1 hypothetical protein CONPUDRAFT_56223 [Coniophora puteana RWD-64-598 SS2]
MNTCPCVGAAQCLLRAGLFPCAPSPPTLAVDLCVLWFIEMLALCTAPNVSAWTDTLEAYLRGMGYKLPMKVNLCCFHDNLY